MDPRGPPLKGAVGPMFFFVLVISMLNLRRGHCDGDAVHAREFDVLCRLVRISEAARKMEVEACLGRLSNWDGVAEVRGELDKYMSQANGTVGFPVGVQISGMQIDLTESGSQARAVGRLRAILGRLHTLEQKVAGLKTESREECRKAKQEAELAISGDGKSLDEAEGGVAKARYVDASPTRETVCATPDPSACAGAATAIRAGCDLVHDIMCLCTPGQTSASHGTAICGVSAGTQNTNGWYQGSKGSTLNTAVWRKLKESCAKRTGGDEFTAVNIENALQSFRALLGAQLTGVTSTGHQFAWVLGKPTASSGSCSGANSNSMCVNYAAAGTYDLGEIKWKTHLEAAAANLRKAHYFAQKANTTILQAYSLLVTAEALLTDNETSRVSSEGSVTQSGPRPNALEKPTVTPQNQETSGALQQSSMVLLVIFLL